MIIIDLDNCACDDSHRLNILGLAPGSNKPSIVWDSYHGACLADIPANQHIWSGRSDIIVMTGRPWKFLAHTDWWAQRHGLKWLTIFMRSTSDHITSAVDLKREWARQLLQAGYHIDRAFDDRQDIVDAYSKLGINATRAYAHTQEWV